MKKNDEFLEHIRSGKLYPEPFFYIRGILIDSELENYYNICADRIAEAWLFDSKHVMLDLFGDHPGEVVIDRIGLRKCSNILKSYITNQKYEYWLNLVDEHSKLNRLRNDQLEELHSFTDDTLKSLIEEVKNTDIGADEAEYFYEQFKAELESRKPFRVIKGEGSRMSGLKSEIKQVVMSRRYNKIIQKSLSVSQENLTADLKLVRRNKDRRKCMSENKWLVYFDAYEDFVKDHGGSVDVDELTREENMKFAYLGVNRYGRFYWDKMKNNDKTPVSISKEYDAFSIVMESISRLTPSEIQQIFPIDKRYDGDKCCDKDYFYTMKRLSKMNPNKPISKCGNVESVLWDYTNRHLTEFAVHYMGNLADWGAYLNDDSKHDEFFKKLEAGCCE